MASFERRTWMLTAILAGAALLAITIIALTGARQAQAADSYTTPPENFTDCGGGWNSGAYDEAGNLYIPCSSGGSGSPSSIRVLNAAGVQTGQINIPQNVNANTADDIFIFDVAPSPNAEFLYVTIGTTLVQGGIGYDYLPEEPRRLNRQGDGSYVMDSTWRLASYPLNGKMYAPRGYNIATDGAAGDGAAGGGNIYVSDPREYASEGTDDNIDSVIKYRSDKTFVTRFGGVAANIADAWGDGIFHHTLNGLTVTPSGRSVYTTENNNNRVQRFERQGDGSYSYHSKFGGEPQNDATRSGKCSTGDSPIGTVATSFAGAFAAPYNVGLDSSGNIYVLSTTCHEVLKFNPQGEFSTGMRVGKDNTNFNNGKPHGFAVARNGNVYIGESGKMMRASTTPPPASSPKVTVVGSATTVRPDTDLTDAQYGAITPPNRFGMKAAKNEFESFQVVIKAGNTDITDLRVDKNAALTGAGGAAIANSNITIYREDDYKVTTPSDGEGAEGLWPDALIPERDYFYGEDRNAFPVNVPAGERVVAWVDVLVPKTAAAGDYSGSLAVTSTSGLQTTVPIGLEVQNFELPSTSSLDSAFLTNHGKPCIAHTGNFDCNGNEEQRWRLHSLYARAGLENKVSISNPTPLGTNSGPPTGQNLAYFNQYVLPLADPGLSNSVRLPGAKLTSFSVYTYNQDDHCKPACVDQWEAFVAEKGLAERTFLYACDEPNNNAPVWTACNTSLNDQTNLRKLVTTTVDQASGAQRLSSIDILSPVVNRMHDKSGTQHAGNQRDEYDQFLSAPGVPANKLWMYTSNLSFGSNGEDNDTPDEPYDHPYWDGWPGYAIDQPATQSRAMGWLSFSYGASGELYHHTTQKLGTAWNDGGQYSEGGNGDGTLFYPGTPATIGGSTHIPVESIRLKRIRDGREDYEYLKLLADRGKEAEAGAVADSLFPTMYDATATQVELDAARNQLVALIGGNCQNAASSSAGVTVNGNTITGTAGPDIIVGTDGENTIRGLGGDDLICGKGGYDSIYGDSGDDTLDGGLGLDALYYTDATSAVVVNLATGTATGEGTDTIASFTEVYGSPQGDTITGDGETNYLDGGGGGDTVTGSSGDDWLVGGEGDDTVNSRDNAVDQGGSWYQNSTQFGVACGAGSDRVIADAEGTDKINLGDCENIEYPGGGDDTMPPNTTITGGPAEGSTVNSNLASFSFSSSEANSTFECKLLDEAAFSGCTSPTSYTSLRNGSHTFEVRAKDAAGNTDLSPASRSWTITNEDPCQDATIVGDDGANTLSGTNARDIIDARGGGDTITNIGTGDVVCGGSGEDKFKGFTANSTLYGGDGAADDSSDNVDFSGVPQSGLGVSGSLDNIISGPGFEIMTHEISDVTGSPNDDSLNGNVNNNYFVGGNGDDVLRGHRGNDVIDGGAGEDDIEGGEGNDTIKVRDGRVDDVVCGPGADRVEADQADRVAADCETVERPPSVSATTPAGTRVAPSANATATFSEAMRPATINRATVKLVKRGTQASVPATVTYNATARRVTLNPTRNLAFGTFYTATVTTGVRDLVGNPLAANKTWTFKVKPRS